MVKAVGCGFGDREFESRPSHIFFQKVIEKLNKNVVGIKGPILPEVETNSWDFSNKNVYQRDEK